MRFFHATTQKSANAILREGFRDGEGSYMFSPEDLEEAFGRPTLSGVFVASGPTSSQDGAAGDVVLELELSEEFDVTPVGHRGGGTGGLGMADPGFRPQRARPGEALRG